MAESFWFRYFLHRVGLIENHIHLVSTKNSCLMTHACQIVLVEDKLVLLLANGLFSVVCQIRSVLMNRSKRKLEGKQGWKSDKLTLL